MPGPIPAELVRVIDGDTVEVRAWIWPELVVTTRVRLAGMDAPEMEGECAAERDLARRARDYIAARVGEIVRLYEVRPGKYAGRVIARVETTDGLDLAAALIEAGLGRPYEGGRREEWCS
ncbi:MAG: thermonuclease family protein [Proteobacteria bacterium]|nr:thermonuclease family protein [Pseudomonadota bacterium]